jgi:hypothetical protein
LAVGVVEMVAKGRILLPTEIEQCLQAIKADATKLAERREYEMSKLKLPQHAAVCATFVPVTAA